MCAMEFRILRNLTKSEEGGNEGNPCFPTLSNLRFLLFFGGSQIYVTFHKHYGRYTDRWGYVHNNPAKINIWNANSLKILGSIARDGSKIDHVIKWNSKSFLVCGNLTSSSGTRNVKMICYSIHPPYEKKIFVNTGYYGVKLMKKFSRDSILCLNANEVFIMSYSRKKRIHSFNDSPLFRVNINLNRPILSKTLRKSMNCFFFNYSRTHNRVYLLDGISKNLVNTLEGPTGQIEGKVVTAMSTIKNHRNEEILICLVLDIHSNEIFLFLYNTVSEHKNSFINSFSLKKLQVGNFSKLCPMIVIKNRFLCISSSNSLCIIILEDESIKEHIFPVFREGEMIIGFFLMTFRCIDFARFLCWSKQNIKLVEITLPKKINQFEEMDFKERIEFILNLELEKQSRIDIYLVRDSIYGIPKSLMLN